MPNIYELRAESAGLDTTYSVYKNEHRILYLVPKEKAEEYIKFNKKADREYRILNKNFEINSICREDLIEYIGKKQALELNNDQMKNIARKMGDYHMYIYWDDLTDILQRLDIKLLENYEE